MLPFIDKYMLVTPQARAANNETLAYTIGTEGRADYFKLRSRIMSLYDLGDPELVGEMTQEEREQEAAALANKLYSNRYETNSFEVLAPEIFERLRSIKPTLAEFVRSSDPTIAEMMASSELGNPDVTQIEEWLGKDIARVYATDGMEGVRSGFVGILGQVLRGGTEAAAALAERTLDLTATRREAFEAAFAVAQALYRRMDDDVRKREDDISALQQHLERLENPPTEVEE